MGKVSFKGVSKLFGSVEAVKQVSLEIDDGEFIVLLGPSGCGKTTLLRMLAGLELISSGQIEVDGRAVNDLAPKDRDIAMVFQNYALYPHMTVYENMAFSLRQRRKEKAEISERVQWAADLLEISPYLKRHPRELSGGQRQRVAMGRALVRHPRVFLFDEPLSNLDAKLRVQMRMEIKALHQRLKITTLYVTHDQTEAMTMADRIVMMNGGEIEQVDLPLEIYDRPVNKTVAEFIGSPGMNLFDGTIEQNKAGMSVALKNAAKIPVAPATGLSQGQKVLLGVRPEHVEPHGSDGDLQAQVVVVEPTGDDTIISLVTPDGIGVTSKVSGRIDLLPESRVFLRFSHDSVHLFSHDGASRLN